MHLRSVAAAFGIVVFSAAGSAQPIAPFGNCRVIQLFPLPPACVLPAGGTFGATLNFLAPDAYQVDYLPAAGGAIAGGVVNLSNAGELGADAFGPLSGTTGDICVNVYTFTADEQESECCQCLVTPNALRSLTAAQLVGNPGNGVTPTLGLVVKLLATIPGTATGGIPAGVNTQGAFSGTTCNAAQPFSALGTALTGSGLIPPAPDAFGVPGAGNLAPGMVAWAVKFHSNTPVVPAGIRLTETQFSSEALSQGELTKLTNLCQFLKGNQSGAGTCPGCALGGLGASRH